LRADYILANPPFNLKDWGGDKLEGDPRWQYGVPPTGNANFAWLQHMVARLGSDGRMGTVLANGSLSSTNGGEGAIRAALVKADLVECMVAMPGQLFANTQIPVCLWLLSKDKAPGKHGEIDRRGQVLFIDAGKLGTLIPGSRKQKELSNSEIARIASAYHSWRGTRWSEDEYRDQSGYCYSASVDEIETHGYMLTPGRYVGTWDIEDDGVAFEERMTQLTNELFANMKKSKELDALIRHGIGKMGYGEQ